MTATVVHRSLQTAEADLTATPTLLQAGLYAQACFYAQRSAERAVKSLCYRVGAEPWGPSVQRLVTEFPQPESLPDREQWIEHGALLDELYTPLGTPTACRTSPGVRHTA